MATELINERYELCDVHEEEDGRQERTITMKAWIASNVPDWTLEECDLPITDSAITVSQWMSEPDSNSPSVIRWLSESVCGDYIIEGVKTTAQWKSLGDGIGEVCTGSNEVLETIVCVYSGNRPEREKDHWNAATGGKIELPTQRPLVVLTHRPAVKEGQQRVGNDRVGSSVSLALAYAVDFLNRAEQGRKP
jgi:hypothetical protein